MGQEIFFGGWSSLGRVLLVGTLAYLGLVALLRISGKRTLSKMNAFDLVVTVAMGSTLATILLDRSLPLADGVLAFVLLIFLQYAITWCSVRWEWFQSLVKAKPSVLVSKGTVLTDVLRKERVTFEEIEAAIRQNGMDGIDTSLSVRLETDGTFSVVQHETDRVTVLNDHVHPRD